MRSVQRHFSLTLLLLLTTRTAPAAPSSAGPAAYRSAPADTGLAGHWEGNMTDESKIFAITFDFRVDKGVVTGTLEVPSLDRVVPIKSVTVKGNAIAFKGFGKWTGVLAGDQLTLTRELDFGKKQHMIAHRVATTKAR